jgi:hypothetical protein
LTFSADETLEDGSTVRTLETPAATIRFCFIDNVSSDSDSEEAAGNADVWKPPDITPNFASSSSKGSNGLPEGSTKVTDVRSGNHNNELSNSFGNQEKTFVTEEIATVVNSVSRTSSGNTESISNTFQEEKVQKIEASLEEKTSIQCPNYRDASHRDDACNLDYDQGVLVDERFVISEVKIEIAVNHSFVKEHSSSPEKSLSDPHSVGTCSSSGSPSSNVVSVPRSPRFNPFDHDVFVEEDHFSMDGSLLKGNRDHASRHSLPNVMSPVKARGKKFQSSVDQK